MKMNTAYRVWDGEQMHYWDDEGLSLEINRNGWVLWREEGRGCRVSIAESGDGDVLMWGTDQKGVYDGDVILRDETEIGSPFGAGVFVGVVSMLEGQWCIVNVKKQETRLLFSETATNTILGDVYQNPELLEGVE